MAEVTREGEAVNLNLTEREARKLCLALDVLIAPSVYWRHDEFPAIISAMTAAGITAPDPGGLDTSPEDDEYRRVILSLDGLSGPFGLS